MARLGDVIEQIRGVSYKPSDLGTKLDDDHVILLRANNIKEGRIVLDDVVYVSKNKVSDKQYLRYGDILVCTSSGSKELVGKAAFVNEDLDMVFGAFCKTIRPKIDCSEYIGHFFQSPYYRNSISSVSTGANINNLRNENISDLQISLPSYEKQRRIVAVLDKVSDLILKRCKQLDELNELVSSRFMEMFGDPKTNEKGWKTGIISDYYDVKGGKRIPKGMGYADGVTKHPYLRATDMKNETIIEEDIHYIDEDVFQYIKRYTVKGGDVYLTNVGVNLGMAGVIPNKFDGANLTENAVKLVPKTEKVMEGIFLAHYINSSGIQDYINERKMAVGVPKLAIFRIETMPLLLPPKGLQDEFASFVRQADKSKLTLRKSLEKLQTLKKSLMQKYFG